MKWPNLKLPERKPKEPKAETSTHRAALWQFWALVIVGVIALLGSTWMLLVFIAGSVGHVDWWSNYKATEKGVETSAWGVEMDIHWLVGLGLFFFCAAIATYNAVWLELRRHLFGLHKTVMTWIGCCVALFMISGATVVQQRGSDARTRDEVIAAQSAQAGQAGAEERLKQIKEDLDRLTDKTRNNEYAANAANVGEAQYRATYMAPDMLKRETPERRRLIERAVGSAQQADALKAERERLTAQLTMASVVTVKAEAQSVKATGFMANAASVLEDVRKPVTALLGELLAMTVFSAALAAWASRQQAMAQEPRPLGVAFQIADKAHPSTADMPIADVIANKMQGVPKDLRYQGPIIWQDGFEMAWVDGYVREKDKKYIEGHYRKTGRRADILDTQAVSPGDPRIAANAADEADEIARAAQAEVVESVDGEIRFSDLPADNESAPAHGSAVAGLRPERQLAEGQTTERESHASADEIEAVEASNFSDPLNAQSHGTPDVLDADAAQSSEPEMAAVLGIQGDETLNAQPQEDSADPSLHDLALGNIRAGRDEDAVVSDQVSDVPRDGEGSAEQEPQPITLQEAADGVANGTLREIAVGVFEPVPHEESGEVIEAEDTNFMATRRGLPSPEKEVA